MATLAGAMDRLLGLPRGRARAYAFALLGVVAAGDYSTGTELSIATLYLAPIMLASWACSARWGLAFCALALLLQAALMLALGLPPARVPFFAVVLLNRALFYVLIAMLTAGMRAMYERERGLARVDSLTGVANRLQLADTLQREMRRHARTHRPFCIAYIDCDGFKAINDRLGHLEGDRLLRVAAQTISRHVRGGDFVARVGGDEFVVLFADAEGSALAGTLAGLRQALRERFTTEGWNVTFSIGLVTFRSMPASAEDALACADRAMYEAKSQGRDRVVQRQYVASA